MEGPRAALDDMLKWWSQNGEPVTTFIEPATAQPDARDAEIAQLKSKGYALRGEAARLTKELEEARARVSDTERAQRQTERTLDVYAKAWGREIGPPYRAKTHLIDSLVLTTQDRIASLRAAEKRADAAEAQAKVLREALEFARRLPMAKKNRAILTAALAPPEPKAETPAETAGQKGGP